MSSLSIHQFQWSYEMLFLQKPCLDFSICRFCCQHFMTLMDKHTDTNILLYSPPPPLTEVGCCFFRIPSSACIQTIMWLLQYSQIKVKGSTEFDLKYGMVCNSYNYVVCQACPSQITSLGKKEPWLHLVWSERFFY